MASATPVTPRVTQVLPAPAPSRTFPSPTTPRAGGSASHLADLATARVEHPPLFRALDVFRVP